MRTPRPAHTNNDRSRRILGMAIALLVLGGVLLVLSFILGANPRLQPVGMGFRQAAPYVLLIGIGLLVVYAVLRPDPEAGSPSTHGPTLFGKDSTDFVSHMDRDANEDPTVTPQDRR